MFSLVCPLFSVKHGTVQSEGRPFFLAGDKVEVACREKYGVKRINYNSSMIVSCFHDFVPPSCSLLTVEEEKKGKIGGG